MRSFLREILCLNCNKSFGLYNEKYYSDKALEKIAKQQCALHAFYGHEIIIKAS